jgi:ABC-2 type transport system ATP-binding protein
MGHRGGAVNALAVRDVSHAFGATRVLDHVSFSVPVGRFAVLVGPNGAGKTTLFALVTRLYNARNGHIEVLGHDLVRHPSAALAGMGVVFQLSTLDVDLTVRQNLRYHAALHGISRREGDARADEELARLDVAHLAGRGVRTLSGGEKRRVEIARALLHRPRLLLLDEASTGLDPGARSALLVHVRSLCRERELTVLWATHLLDEADGRDLAIVLEQGRVTRSGVAAEIGVTAHGGTPRIAALQAGR